VKQLLLSLLIVLALGSLASAEGERFSIPLEGSPVIGPATAPVTIVEFIDYQ
jgi:protein-disulfide isomerase